MRKMLFKRRLVVLCSFLVLSLVVGSAQGISLNYSQKDLKTVLEEVSQQSGYSLAYSKEVVNLNDAVTIEVSNAELSDVLNELLLSRKLNYEIRDSKIYILDKSTVNTTKSFSAKKEKQYQERKQIQISGLVTDPDGLSIIGANISVLGTKVGTITDVDGKYTLSVPRGSVLRFSYIGYNNQDIKITNQTIVNVSMIEDVELLDEVVVIGYGSVKKSDATGSVVAIKQEKSGSQTTAQDALVGKIAGVNVVPGSGAPGEGATIRIRSGASLSASNDPLIIIDGIPVDNSSIEGSSNLIGSINPNDIEMFTVLKDASATAIYGSRASNGVVIITTKKGSSNGLRINYNGNFSISSNTDKLDVLTSDEFIDFVPTVTGVPSQPQFGNTSTNWQDEIYRVAFGQEHYVSAAGSIDKFAPYRVSIGYTNQEGVIKTNKYERLNFSGSINSEFLDKHLNIDFNAKFSKEDNRRVDNSIVGNALSYDPTRPVMIDGSDNSNIPGLGYFIWMNGNSPMAIQTDNPVAQIDLQEATNDLSRFMGSSTIDYKLHGFEDLRFNLNLGYDGLTSKYIKKVPEMAGMMYTQNQKDGTSLSQYGKHLKRNYLLDFYGNYDATFNDEHALNIMGGYGWQHFWKRYDFKTNDLKGVELASPKHYESEYYLLSFFGRLNYSYINRYMVTATLRSDASSRFSKDNRWGIFPSLALGWRINDESFFRDIESLSNLKLRLSYGTTGQQDIIDDYPYMSTFTVSYPESSYQFGDKWFQTYRPNGYDEDIKWETTDTYNIGVDFGFINNRVYGSFDYYKRYTSDLLNKINVIAGTNYSPVLFTNIGKMENYGLEFSLNAIPIHTKDWEWSVGFNYTNTHSKLTKLNVVDSKSTYVETGAISGTGKFVQVFMIDETPYTYYLAKQAYDSEGDPIEGSYIQPDGSISEKETRSATGKSSLPTSLLGINSKLIYKKWDLAINGHGSFGNYIYNYIAADQFKEQVYSDQGSYSNILKKTRDIGFNQQRLYTDYFLEKGSFFRIDNITLGYVFDNVWNSKSSIRATFTVQNVATFTGYSGLDPEIYSGIDRNIYPRPRTYSIGINLMF